MSTATDYLRKALDALLAERSNLDQQIEVISRTLGELEPHDLDASPPTVTKVTSWPEGFQPGFVRTRISRPVIDIVLELARAQTVFTTEELMTALKAEGNTAQRASVSSTLSRMVREGTLAKGPRRGSFQRVEGSVVDQDTLNAILNDDEDNSSNDGTEPSTDERGESL